MYENFSFGGEIITPEDYENPEKKKNFDFMLKRNSQETRYPEMKACVTALRQELNFKNVGAIGFCYGGWAVFKLAAKGLSSPLPSRSTFH